MEIRKDIEGFEDIYQISNMGNVKSIERLGYRRTGTYTIPERILKQFETTYNTRSVTLYTHDINKPGKNKKYRVHQLVAKHFVPNPEEMTEISHIDGDKTNNKADNLRWQTSVTRALNGFKARRERNKE